MNKGRNYCKYNINYYTVMSHIVQFKIKMMLKRLFIPKLYQTAEMVIGVKISKSLIKYEFYEQNLLIHYL